MAICVLSMCTGTDMCYPCVLTQLQLAFSIMPQTFSLPDELGLFREYLSKQQHQGGTSEVLGEPSENARPCVTSSSSLAAPSEELWIIKTAQHLGKGLKLMTVVEAGKEAGRRK